MLLRSLFFHPSVIFFTVMTLISCSGGGGDDPPPPDTKAPSVILGSPTPTGLDVVRNTTVSVTFSEAMDNATIDSTTFQVKTGGADVPGTISRSGNTYTFTPAALLQSNTQYDITITRGVTDLAGNALATQNDWSFTTDNTLAVDITWDPNREKAVNTTGGGYTVYYDTNPIADPPGAIPNVDVPYVSGPTAPTSISLNLQSATTYYFRVVAYSGPPINSTSAPSAEQSFVVP